MSDIVEGLKGLHTTLIDSLAGYKEARADAENADLAALFQEMIELRERHHVELDQLLRVLGQSPDESGSFMAAVHRTVIKVRSAVSGLDEDALSGFIDGEQRIAQQYEETLRANPPAGVLEPLTAQLQAVTHQIAKMTSLSARGRA